MSLLSVETTELPVEAESQEFRAVGEYCELGEFPVGSEEFRVAGEFHVVLECWN